MKTVHENLVTSLRALLLSANSLYELDDLTLFVDSQITMIRSEWMVQMRNSDFESLNRRTKPTTDDGDDDELRTKENTRH